MTRTDASFWRSGSRVLPKVEGRVSRSSYRAGWQRLTFRIGFAGAVTEGGYLLGRDLDTSLKTAQSLWEEQDTTLAALQTGGIGVASAAAVGGLAYGALTRKRRELMREWVRPLHEALAKPLGMSELTDPRRYLHVPKNFNDDDAQIRVDVPTNLEFNEALVADLIVKKLALENVSFTRRLHPPHHRQAPHPRPGPREDPHSPRPSHREPPRAVELGRRRH
ncbi:hypothetical protein [Streptomyces sp. C10]|uniref:hypothetical protein n=1 Tax=Streptomyces sp. C10 TaxID=531941 RepID=UPI00397EAE1B